MPRISLYIPEPITALPLAPWFEPLSEHITYKKDLPPNFFETEVERVARPEDAIAIVLPNNFKDHLSPEAQAYVKGYADLGEKIGKPVIAFSLGDFTDTVDFDPRVYVLRLSLYVKTKRPRDICMPTLTEDNARGSITLRPKQEKPMVSFVGMGDVPTLKSRLSYHAKNLLLDMQAFLNEGYRARKIGIFWRRAMMRACEHSPLVDTHFIVRKTFSGSKKTIEIDPAQARKEYLDSIIDSDFVLAPKGDGNYSNRFLKTLCMGRIPVLVDTDVVLPLEEAIDYSTIVVRVPMSEVARTPDYIRRWYDALTEEEWQKRQTLARETFEAYLRQDSFLRYFFTSVLPTPA